MSPWIKGRDFPASRSLLGLGPFSSSLSLRRPARGLRASSSAMRLSMAASDSGTKGQKLSGPGGTSSCAILSSCSFRGQRGAQLVEGGCNTREKHESPLGTVHSFIQGLNNIFDTGGPNYTCHFVIFPLNKLLVRYKIQSQLCGASMTRIAAEVQHPGEHHMTCIA